MADTCYQNQNYFANNVWEAILLVSSNAVLLPVTWRAMSHGYKTRAYLSFAAFTASVCYHLCIIAPLFGESCVLHFCALKLLDYTPSYTILITGPLLLVPFNAFYRKEDLDKPKTIIKPDFTFVDDWIIFSCAIYVAVVVGEINGFGPLTWLQLAIPLIFVILVVIFSWVHIYVVFKRKPTFDIPDLIAVAVLSVFGIFMFLIEYVLNPTSYWATHSLWHLLGGLAYLYLIEARNKKRSGFWALFPSHQE